MLVTLLGAGFSKWAAGLPLASELFDFQIEAFGTREQTRLHKVETLKANWDRDHPVGHPEQFIGTVLSSGCEGAKRLLLWYIARRLSEPYIWREWHAGRWRRHVLVIDEHRKNSRPGVAEARRFFTRLGIQLGGIVTPNYDLLVEYALGTKGFCYGGPGEILLGRGPYPLSQWLNPVRLTGRIPLAKLHGSISWDAQGRYTDGRRGITGDALIVAPTAEKVPPPELADEWALSSEILRKAGRVLVFGFAFNPYDTALLEHLHKFGDSVTEVAVVDVVSRAKESREVWPNAEVSWFRPLGQDDRDLDLWLHRRDQDHRAGKAVAAER